MSRTPMIAGNWKMNHLIADAEAFIGALLPKVAAASGVEIVVCPSYLAIQPLLDSARGSQVAIYAQNMHQADSGAYTGEVAAPMLAEIGATGVIVGHSERRQYFNETDAALQQKVPKALEHGLVPILCVGESQEEREGGAMEDRLRHQIAEDLAAVPDGRLADVVVAYEPVWAIGTGLTATPDQAQEAVAFIRERLADIDADAAADVRILYGGSCNPGNAAELLALPDVDGALVGGASLKADDFAALIEAAQRVAA